MNKLFLIILISTLLASCASVKLKPYKKALSIATAQPWASGARGGNRGVTFRLKFYQLEALTADTLWVNKVPMGTEITKVGDTTYVTSFFSTSQDEPAPKLVTDTTYLGYLNVFVKEDPNLLKIESFERLPMTLYP